MVIWKAFIGQRVYKLRGRANGAPALQASVPWPLPAREAPLEKPAAKRRQAKEQSPKLR